MKLKRDKSLMKFIVLTYALHRESVEGMRKHRVYMPQEGNGPATALEKAFSKGATQVSLCDETSKSL